MKRILCYGDSNTYGANPYFRPDLAADESIPQRWPADIRWTKLLQKGLGSEYEIIEEGLCGRTTIYRDNAWPFCEGREYFTPCILSKMPVDLIVIMLGTNDLKAIFAPSRDSIGLAMMEFLKVVKNPFLYSGYKMPKVLVVSPIFIGGNIKNSFMYGTYTEKSVEISHMFPEVYGNVASMFDCEFMRASDFAAASDVDSVHLDEENHRKLAEALKEKIKEIL
jgi:lysophospholipase L1-like esterase